VKRDTAGAYHRISSERAIDEIATQVRDVIEHHGPEAVALYFGTGIASFWPLPSVAAAWMQAIGSPMMFSANTIDKPGSQIAQAAHGTWQAGHPPFESADAWVLVGLNPVVSRSGGFPPNNPATRLKEAVIERGMKLIVIDPRTTQSAQRAHIHLQIKPGEDPTVLAGMLHVILTERLFDTASDDLLEMLHQNSRIPLDVVKRYPHGRVFTEVDEVVRPADADCVARLDVGDPQMMDELGQIGAETPLGGEPDFPFLLIPRRINHLMNSSGRTNGKLAKDRTCNPAFVHPADMESLGLASGSLIRITSAHGDVTTVIEADEHLRRGVVSITHGYGGNPDEHENPREVGCNVGRLMSADAEFDPVTGIPRMGALPVSIRRLS
jgi:anaerobic selenocysteine-containing dehydrogenase